MSGEKTEKATPKRKQDERKKGNVFLSREIVTISTLMIVFYVMKSMMPSIISTIGGSVTHYIDLAGETEVISYDGLRSYFIDLIITFIKTALIPLLVCCLTAVIVTMLQTRMLFSAKAFQFKGERINPLSGFKKMFSMRSIVELLKSILKIGILIYVLYSIIKDEIFLMPRMMDMTFTGVLSKTGSIIMNIISKAGLIFIFLGAADYLYQWWQYEKNLRMSKQEIKDEYKQTEGDPQVKGRIRSMQQQRARQRMMQSVPEADVVIRNPTHFAVAIKYDQSSSRAPVVIAKGMDSLALKIIEVAEENNVYVTENKPLARALYDAVELGGEIPERFYRPIAEVLAFVYNLRKKDMSKHES
ncbi:MAG: flagellar biosynthesis protein FlhB [Clostridiales bacterium]|nr:flagellar biosynthesis protein FlhB [Clostridiales bacterium]